MRTDVHLFKNRIVTKWQNVSIGRQQSFFKFRGENPPRGAFIHFWLKKTPKAKVQITIENENFQNQYKSEMSITGKPGVNMVNWNMRFPVPKKDVMKFKERLIRILNELAVLVKTDEEKDEISELQETVKRENTQRNLRSIHRRLTRNFASFSQGRDFFGSSLQQLEAFAGEYKIILNVDGKSYTGKLNIRNDPLLDK
jgi:hypothetical protein